MRRFAGVVLSTLALAACGGSKPSAETAGPVDHAARVEAGLRASIRIAGTPETTFTLAERMQRYKVPGISIAVVDGGTITWAKGYGLKVVGTADSVTPTTLFQAASISKPVAATGMMHLVDEGKLALDEPINTYLKSWKLPDNRFTAQEKVTLRRIASHSAGLTVHGFPGYAVTDPVPTVPQVLDGAKPANTAAVRVDTTPGAISRYSGGGITIEQLAMADVTGEDFNALMKRLVLDPIGMTNSGYDQPLAEGRRGQEAAAYNGKGEPIAGKWHVYPEKAAAGLWTTPTDLLKWAMELAAARDGKSTKVVSQKAATEMLAAQKGDFGIGPALGGTGDGFHFGHGGANEGFRCEVIYFPALGKGAAVMTNSDNGDALNTEVLYAIAKEYGWPGYGPREVTVITVDSASLESLVGTYTSKVPATRVTVSRKGAGLVIVEPQYIPETPLAFLAPDSAISPVNGLPVKFRRGKDGKVTGLDVAGIALTRVAR